MSAVMSRESSVVDSEFRNGAFGLQLWMEESCEDWDTNTGMSGTSYTRWRKATKAERQHFVRYQG